MKAGGIPEIYNFLKGICGSWIDKTESTQPIYTLVYSSSIWCFIIGEKIQCPVNDTIFILLILPLAVRLDGLVSSLFFSSGSFQISSEREPIDLKLNVKTNQPLLSAHLCFLIRRRLSFLLSWLPWERQTNIRIRRHDRPREYPPLFNSLLRNIVKKVPSAFIEVELTDRWQQFSQIMKTIEH